MNALLPFRELAQAVRQLVEELSRCRKQLEQGCTASHSGPATKQDVERMEKKIMSVISQFAEKQNAFNDRQDAAITGLTEDVQALNDIIAEFQNSPGAVTPEDQELLNKLEARGEVISTKLEALNALTPPKPPAA